MEGLLSTGPTPSSFCSNVIMFALHLSTESWRKLAVSSCDTPNSLNIVKLRLVTKVERLGFPWVQCRLPSQKFGPGGLGCKDCYIGQTLREMKLIEKMKFDLQGRSGTLRGSTGPGAQS